MMKKILQPRRAITIVGVILVASLIGLFAYHQYAWGQYVQQNDDMYVAARETINKQLSDDGISLDTINQMSDSASSAADELCDSSVIFYQLRLDLLESARSEQSECEKRKAKLTKVVSAVTDVRDYLLTDKKVGNIFDETGELLADINSTEYTERKKIWKDALSALQEVTDNEDYKPHISSYKSAIKDIIDGYSAIIKANKDENRAQFDDASASLNIGYDEPTKVAKSSAKTLSSLVQDMLTQADKL